VYVKIKYHKFPTSEAAAILTKEVTSHRLFRESQASVISTMHMLSTNHENVIYRVLMNMESYNMGLLPYNFDPEYSVDEINSRLQLRTETTSQQSPFPVRLQSFYRKLTIHQRYCFGFI
jgi:predicted O-linked N-acetylglucosamine transferase (SPINDLY family)